MSKVPLAYKTVKAWYFDSLIRGKKKIGKQSFSILQPFAASLTNLPSIERRLYSYLNNQPIKTDTKEHHESDTNHNKVIDVPNLNDAVKSAANI